MVGSQSIRIILFNERPSVASSIFSDLSRNNEPSYATPKLPLEVFVEAGLCKCGKYLNICTKGHSITCALCPSKHVRNVLKFLQVKINYIQFACGARLIFSNDWSWLHRDPWRVVVKCLQFILCTVCNLPWKICATCIHITFY